MNDTKRTRPLASSVDQRGSTPGARNHHDCEVGNTQALLYVSSKMAELEAMVKKCAKRDGNVLLTGESGVGKDVVARYLHSASPRSRQPFFALNCGAVLPDLILLELFGADRGAFTGAHVRRTGLLESAHRSSFFLDEIGELALTEQPKLLRFLQDREVRRVGDTKSIKVDVRIIAATNRDLEAMVRKRQFRLDLFQRLKVLHIHIPSLRERPEDIDILLSAFLRKLGIDEPLNRFFTPAARALLKQYPWPGNVRELEHLAERLEAHREPGQVFDRPDVEALLGRSLEPITDFTPPSSDVQLKSQEQRRRPGPKPKWIDVNQVNGWLADNLSVSQICQKLGISRSRFYSRPEIRALLRSSCFCF